MLQTYPTTSLNVSPAEAAQELLARRLARRDLIEFSCYVDPAAERWYRAAHLKKIADFATHVSETPHGRGIVVCPPRFWKSSVCSEKFPAKYLGSKPTHSLIEVTNSDNLALSFSRNVRAIIESDRFRNLYDARIKYGSNEVQQWSLEQAYRYSFRAAGVGTNIMGGGANGLIVDDLFKDWAEAQSQTIKDSRWDWLTKTAFNRLEPDAWILIVCTRFAVDDHVGRILDEMQNKGAEEWEILNLPLTDEKGAPLWEDRFGYDEIANIKSRPGATEQYIQMVYYGKATLTEGNLIKRDWFEYVPQLPDGVAWQVCAIDVAFTEKQTERHDPDYTAKSFAARANNCLYLGKPQLTRVSVENVPEFIVNIKQANPSIRVGIGKVAIKASIVKAMKAAGFSIEEYDETTDKIARASAWLWWARQGRVKLVGTEAEWEPFLSQFVAFPNSTHDDAIDSISGDAQMLGVTIEVYVPHAKSRSQRDEIARRLYG